MTPDYHEDDYCRMADPAHSTQFLPRTSIEIIGHPRREHAPRHILFDFDGTLSLIREGWPEVMIPMMVEVLADTGTDETAEMLHQKVADFVMQLNGKQTIYQMIRLCEEVRQRGVTPSEPTVYKQEYHRRLMQRVAHRREGLESGRVDPEAMLVPGSFEMLRGLRERGVQLYLASGTDEAYVLEESRLLKLDEYFGPRIYGARDDYKTFSKAMVIERILRENRVDGSALLGFGDGYVEIQNVKSVGGLAVAVASDEAGRSGKPDPWKRDRLVGVGADLVIPDFRESRPLLAYLWNEIEEK